MDDETLATLALMGMLSKGPEIPEEDWEEYVLTAYCPDARCTGPSSPERGGHGLTRSGKRPVSGRTIAVDRRLHKMGDDLDIEGLGIRRAEDTGSAIKGRRIDVFMDDHDEAVKFGRQVRRVRKVRR